MKQKLIVLGLILGLSGIQTYAIPHQPIHGCHHTHIHARPVPPPHHHSVIRPMLGISFSNGALTRRDYLTPYYSYNCPIGYNSYYLNYPAFYIGVGF